MLEYNEELMEQAKQMFPGGKHKPAIRRPNDNDKKPPSKKARKNPVQRTLIEKRTDLVVNLSIIITLANAFVLYASFSCSGIACGGLIALIPVVFVSLVLMVINTAFFLEALSLFKKAKKSGVAMKTTAERCKKDATLAFWISAVSSIPFITFVAISFSAPMFI